MHDSLPAGKLAGKCFVRAPGNQTIRMELYIAAAMASGASLCRTGRESREDRREGLFNGREFFKRGGNLP
jgi:hypothetical protein